MGVVSASQDSAMNNTISTNTGGDDISLTLHDEISVDKLQASDNEMLSIDVGGSTFADIQTAINNAADGETIYLGGKTFTSSGSTINVNKNVIICGGTSDNPDSVSTLNGNGNGHAIFDFQFVNPFPIDLRVKTLLFCCFLFNFVTFFSIRLSFKDNDFISWSD